MTFIEDHTASMRTNRLATYLAARMQKFRGRAVTPGLLREVYDLLQAYAVEAKRAGVKDWPPLTVFCIPRLGYLRIVRRDMEKPGIVTTLLNATVDLPGQVTAADLAEAAAAAWGIKPRSIDVRPGDVKAKRSEIVL